MHPAVLAILLPSALLVLALAIRRLIGTRQLERIIFEADTPAGRAFDLVLLAAIVLSVAAVMLESEPVIRARGAGHFQMLEWGFALLFSLEYLLRLTTARDPGGYARSFFGVVDFFSSLPPLIGLIVTGSQMFLVVRVFRLLRVFRVLKLGAYLQEADVLWQAIVASRRKIFVFFLTMVILVILIGSLMYLIEGEAGGFTSIPVSVYWAIVTITTVGYGDVAPITPLGRLVASGVMLLGYSIIALPTGIITVGVARHIHRQRAVQACASCGQDRHDTDARHCKRCGAPLWPRDRPARVRIPRETVGENRRSAARDLAWSQGTVDP